MKDLIKQYRKISLLILLMISSTFVAKANKFTLTIKEELANCPGVAPRLCFQVKYKNSKNWENFYSEITGFKYQRGYRYVLKVERTKRKNIPADGSAFTYRLVKIVKRTKMAKSENQALTFIAKHNWKLIQLNGKTLDDSKAFLIFDPKTNCISGNTGCNNLMGNFKMGTRTISFGSLGMNRMVCDEERNNLELDFTKLLGENGLSYDIADQTLNLYKNDKLVMMFGMSPLANTD